MTKDVEQVKNQPGASSCPLEFSVGRTLEDVMEAWGLVYEAYRRLGLVDPNPWGVHCTAHAFTNDTAVIRGCLDGRCVTTITGYLDDPDHGLPLDSVYPDELARLRDRGCSLIEVGLFADRRSELKRARTSLLELMRWATYFGLNNGAQQAVIGVHPHHAKFYAKCLGFEIIGEEKYYGIVNGAPVVPLFLDWQACSMQKSVPRGVAQFNNNPLGTSDYESRKHWRSVALTGWSTEQLLLEEITTVAAA